MSCSTAQGLIIQLQNTKQFFLRSISALAEEDSNYAPAKDVYTVAAQVAHTAITVDWFIDGVFVKGAFDMNFQEHDRQARAVKSLAEAKQMIEAAFANAEKVVGGKSEAELFAPIPAQGIMDGAPKMAAIGGIVDHTAHHRGSLAVYTRLLGKVPPMPYM